MQLKFDFITSYLCISLTFWLFCFSPPNFSFFYTKEHPTFAGGVLSGSLWNCRAGGTAHASWPRHKGRYFCFFSASASCSCSERSLIGPSR